MCTISDSFFGFFMTHLALVAEQPKPDYCRKTVVSELFFFSLQVVHKTVCTIFAQLVFHPKKPGTKSGTFSKNDFALQN